jgi:hypothetical protein
VIAVECAIIVHDATLESNRLQAEERERAKHKQMPNPEDAGGGGSPLTASIDYSMQLEMVDAERRRYRVVGEWRGGSGYGWLHFGAPRASNPYLPDDGAMPSDTADEQPAIWIAGSVSSGTEHGSDSWYVGKTSWAWQRFAAPRIR